MNVAWFSLMWREHVSTKTKGAKDCKEFLLTKPTKRNDLKHVTAVSTFTSSCIVSHINPT